MAWLQRMGIERIGKRERQAAKKCAGELENMGMQVYWGPHQGGTISFRPGCDCEEGARMLAERGIAVRAGLHCAPLAHESAGTLDTGTVRISFGHDADFSWIPVLLRAVSKLPAPEL